MKLNIFPCDRQLDMMDCGPACLKMIAKHHGKFYSLQYLRDKCGITKEGVSFLDLSHAAEDIGHPASAAVWLQIDGADRQRSDIDALI